METLRQDVKQAVRVLARHRGYLATALLTLGVGIGFSTATFSVVDTVLLRPLPYRDPSRLVQLIERAPPGVRDFAVSPAHYLFWREHATAFEGIGAWSERRVNLRVGGTDPERVLAGRVTANLLPLVGGEPVLGRTFQESDDVTAAPRVALLSHSTWQRRFGGRAAAVGETVRIDGQPVEIVGVMGKGFSWPSDQVEIWIPMAFSADERLSYTSHFLAAAGRLKPGVPLERAEADMQRVSERLGEANRGSAGWRVALAGLHEYGVQDVRRPLLVLLGAVALVLLIACVNVANLVLVRGAARHRELAIRSAIGASRGRLLRQLLVEQAVLSVLSSVVGVLVAAWLLRVLLAIGPEMLPRQLDVGIDRRVLAFAVALAAFTPLVFGLLPAIHASRPKLAALLAAGGRQGGAVPARRVRAVLVSLETALAVTLLVGAGLLIRSFTNLVSVSPGFVASHAVVSSVSVPPGKYPRGEARQRFLADIASRLGGVPGVTAVGLAMTMPMVAQLDGGFEIEGRPWKEDRRPIVNFFGVNPGYFAASGTSLVQGRLLAEGDTAGAPRVVVVNQTMVDRYFPGGTAIGQRIRVTIGDGAWREIVGVVADVKSQALSDTSAPQVYESYLHHPDVNAFSIVVRTTAEPPTAVVPAMRSVLRSLDADVPLGQVRTLEEIVAASVRPQRFSTTLIGLFGVAALLLAAVGVYSVMASTVGLRRQEFAIRVAHGASRADILTLVLRGAAGMSAAGIAAGALAAWLLRRVMERLLFGVTPEDGLTYAAVVGLLALVSLAASAVPAIAAARTSPIAALRGE